MAAAARTSPTTSPSGTRFAGVIAVSLHASGCGVWIVGISACVMSADFWAFLWHVLYSSCAPRATSIRSDPLGCVDLYVELSDLLGY
eukprot:7929627-Pyramimonas_sp.AAC.1